MQIATRFKRQTIANESLCLHTLRADCNSSPDESRERNRPFASTRSVQIATRTPTGWRGLSNFASTRSVQIATRMPPPRRPPRRLCLHTLRADCNAQLSQQHPLAAVLCLHTLRADCNIALTGMRRGEVVFASTRSVQIATRPQYFQQHAILLCLHTLRADCNDNCRLYSFHRTALPPHAPCRLQRRLPLTPLNRHFFASTRSVQIATPDANKRFKQWRFASTRSVQIATSASCLEQFDFEDFASTRSVQIATAEMHRMQYALFRTCVESVDSFSVLNKAMLR